MLFPAVTTYDITELVKSKSVNLLFFWFNQWYKTSYLLDIVTADSFVFYTSLSSPFFALFHKKCAVNEMNVIDWQQVLLYCCEFKKCEFIKILKYGNAHEHQLKYEFGLTSKVIAELIFRNNIEYIEIYLKHLLERSAKYNSTLGLGEMMYCYTMTTYAFLFTVSKLRLPAKWTDAKLSIANIATFDRPLFRLVKLYEHWSYEMIIKGMDMLQNNDIFCYTLKLIDNFGQQIFPKQWNNKSFKEIYYSASFWQLLDVQPNERTDIKEKWVQMLVKMELR